MCCLLEIKLRVIFMTTVKVAVSVLRKRKDMRVPERSSFCVPDSSCDTVKAMSVFLQSYLCKKFCFCFFNLTSWALTLGINDKQLKWITASTIKSEGEFLLLGLALALLGDLIAFDQVDLDKTWSGSFLSLYFFQSIVGLKVNWFEVIIKGDLIHSWYFKGEKDASFADDAISGKYRREAVIYENYQWGWNVSLTNQRARQRLLIVK